jgi:hypothetical protein
MICFWIKDPIRHHAVLEIRYQYTICGFGARRRGRWGSSGRGRVGSEGEGAAAAGKHMHHYLYCIPPLPCEWRRWLEPLLHPSFHLLPPKTQLHLRTHSLEGHFHSCLSRYWIRMKFMNDGYKHTPITVYYNYEQEVLLRVLRHLPQEQLPPDPPRALRRQEAQAAHDRTLPPDPRPDGGGHQGQEQQHDMTILI